MARVAKIAAAAHVIPLGYLGVLTVGETLGPSGNTPLPPSNLRAKDGVRESLTVGADVWGSLRLVYTPGIAPAPAHANQQDIWAESHQQVVVLLTPRSYRQESPCQEGKR